MRLANHGAAQSDTELFVAEHPRMGRMLIGVGVRQCSGSLVGEPRYRVRSASRILLSEPQPAMAIVDS